MLTKAQATAAIVTNLPNQLASYEAAVANETTASFKDLSESLTEQINNVLVPYRDKVETGLKVDAQTDAIRDFIADVETNHQAALASTGCTSGEVEEEVTEEETEEE